MTIVRIPYGKSFIEVKIPKNNLVGIVEPNDLPGVKDEIGEIYKAIKRPIRSKGLSELAGPDDKVAIVITDLTRRCPENKILPIILEELKMAGVKSGNTVAVIALGAHRAMTENEIRLKVGKAIYKKIKVLNHDCHNRDLLVDVGTSEWLKTPVSVNKYVHNASIRVLTGVVEYHTFAGYSGGRKTLIPGVSGEETINATHRPSLFEIPNVGPGILEGNPIHKDLVDCAYRLGTSFIVNVVLNSKNQLVKAYAGDLVAAHEKLIKIYDRMYRIEVNYDADVIISCPSYPKDLNLYQASRAANYFALIPFSPLKKGGMIIVPAKCPDGVGDKTFYSLMASDLSLDEIIEKTKKERNILANRPYFMAKTLKYASVVIANSMIPPKIIQSMKMIPASSVERGVKLAFNKFGSGVKILIVKHGISTLVTRKREL